MAGSQLKQLKAALKEKGLIGQTNIKKKNKKSKTPSETRRNDQEKIISDIRSNFNKFDQRVNRTKRDITVVKGGKFVKVGSQQHNDATHTKTSVLKSMKMQYDIEKKKHGKTGGLQDRRFGENNKHLSAEEKMLERFTRERQTQSKKKNVFSISDDEMEIDDDGDDDGFILTHAGKSLVMDEEDNEGLGDSSVKYVDEDQQEGEQPRRKTKKDVMKEVMAKSKFYKHQRQQEQLQRQETIMDLDDEYGDIMQEFRDLPMSKNNNKKNDDDKDYDAKVRELTYDKRSVPADRTKTQEEIQKEHIDKLKKLEDDRIKRMEGLEMNDREGEGDDLDGDFWAGSDDEENGVTVENSENELSENEESGDDSASISKRPRSIRTPAAVMPETHEQFLEQIGSIKAQNQPDYIKKIIGQYKPNLAMGNKEKMNNFIGILFEYVLHLSQLDTKDEELIENLMVIVKQLAESFNQTLVETIRKEIDLIQEKVLTKTLTKRDLVFFIIIGYLFSTSDQYHLIVTPSLILMAEILSQFHYENEKSVLELYQGVLIVDILINYQRISKRYVPEVINFLKKSILTLVPEPEKLGGKATKVNLLKNDKFNKIECNEISIGDLFDENNIGNKNFKLKILIRMIDQIERISSLYHEKSAILEINEQFIRILNHLIKYYGAVIPKIGELLKKLTNIEKLLVKEKRPLKLQSHRQISIATYVPKFEVNFNPDKKSYDSNIEKQEIGKVKAQYKQERKQALKDIRQETKFVAREKIEEKKKMYDAYHKKMASIVNSISTIEGAEKNEYEREKKQRKK